MSVDTRMLLFLLLFVVKAQSQDETTPLRIDCGTDSSYVDTDESYWQADENYIKTGTNRKVSSSNPWGMEQFNSLRAFTEQNKNCYTLPTPTQATYFIRGVFYYGNYDGQLKPPTFDLEIDGNKWTSVITSATDFYSHELIYTPKRDNVSVCLARTQDKQFPFISILEIRPLDDDMYEGMSREVAWLKSYRYNYGGGSNDSKNWILGFRTDDYNRIWQPYDPPGTNVVTAPPFSYNEVNGPPETVIVTVIEAMDPADTINLTFALDRTTNLIYMVAYFTEPRELLNNETRLIDIYVDDDFMFTIGPKIGNLAEAWVRIPLDGTLNVQLRQNGSSTLPPVISAIEVYAASDPLATSTTMQNDLDGLQVLINAYEQLSGWGGDPCLPNNTIWQWLGCNDNDPPRVNKIDLSGYGLNGPLPEFSQMQALETINLGNNRLNGQIPSFFGTLPDLKQLDLQNNNFSGKIPKTITQNKKITYNVKGNPHVHHPKEKKWALIIGLCVSLPVSLILVIALAFFVTRRHPPPPTQGQLTLAELSGLQKVKIQGNHPATQTPFTPSQNNQHSEPISNQGNVAPPLFSSSMSQANQENGHSTPLSTNTVGNSDQFQGFDRNELEELLDLHIRTRG